MIESVRVYPGWIEYKREIVGANAGPRGNTDVSLKEKLGLIPPEKSWVPRWPDSSNNISLVLLNDAVQTISFQLTF